MAGSHEHEVRYFAADWSPDERAAIRQELVRREVPFTLDGEDLLVARSDERMVDMIVESVTET